MLGFGRKLIRIGSAEAYLSAAIFAARSFCGDDGHFLRGSIECETIVKVPP